MSGISRILSLAFFLTAILNSPIFADETPSPSPSPWWDDQTASPSPGPWWADETASPTPTPVPPTPGPGTPAPDPIPGPGTPAPSPTPGPCTALFNSCEALNKIYLELENLCLMPGSDHSDCGPADSVQQSAILVCDEADACFMACQQQNLAANCN